MHQLQIQCCTSCRFLPLRPAPPQLARPRVQNNINNRTGVRAQAWTQVIDQASGKPYYWNTATNETAWEIPSTAAAANPYTTTTASHQEQQEQQQTEASMSNDALFDVLAAAYAADSSGMQFWEVARAHRIYGVFEPPFFDYLERRQKAAVGVDGSDAEGKELAFKIMCRLANPLLRQPAPFE